MEDINEGIRHILSFLHVVQESVDDYRQALGQAYQKEYNAFVEDWKKNNKQKKKVQINESKPDIKVQSKTEVSRLIDIEELNHADKLLEKARKIRKQVPEKRNESSVKLSDRKGNQNTATKKLLSETGQEVEVVPSKLKNDKGATPKCKMPTDCLQKQSKTTTGYQRNICARAVAKPLRPSKEQSSLQCKSTSRKISSIASKSKPPSHLGAAVVSKETFLSLKNLHIDDTAALSSSGVTVAVRKGNNKDPSPFLLMNETAGISEISISQKVLPTHREFCKVLNDRLREQESPFKLDKKWAWYTFLSSKDEVHISRVISCNNYEDLKKANLLLTAIQESMFWLDFFDLIQKEICPHLQKLDKNERSTTQIIQFLRNICTADYTPSAMAHIH